MKIGFFALSAFSLIAFTTSALAEPPASTPLGIAPTTHTPMTRAQSQALWQAAQTKLSADKLYSGPIDGQRNDATVDAIRRFQAQSKLPQTGQLDQVTRQALGI